MTNRNRLRLPSLRGTKQSGKYRALDCFVPRNDGRLSFIGIAFARFRHYRNEAIRIYKALDCFVPTNDGYLSRSA
ncbi:MAG: hypothetical protein LBT42_01075 [Tannerella sp.]|nr:hypothetical protein [Tannerella sp.]